MDLVMEADDEFILLAEDRLELPTHMPDNVQSLPTGGLWRRRSKARVKERQKIVIVGWSDHIGAALVELNEYCGPSTGVWIYSTMPTDDRTKLLESDMCSRQEALSNLTVHHWEGSLGARFCWKICPSKCRAKFPILSDTHASNLGGAGRRCVLVGGGIRGAHEESCGNDARLRQCWGDWAHHCFV